MQRPLYGLATDLTPFEVFAPAGHAPAVEPASVAPGANPSGPIASAAAGVNPAKASVAQDEAMRAVLKAAAIAVGTVVLAFLAEAASRPTQPLERPLQPPPVTSLPTAPLSLNDTPRAVVVDPIARRVQPKPNRVTAAASAPTLTPAERSRAAPDEPLAATLDRFRGGLR